jgi:quinoprotein glucose dehydrogenase
VIYKDLVIVGSNVNDYMVYQRDPQANVRAYNAHTGNLAWTFHTVPVAGETGVETWGDGSEKVKGHTNVWAPFTVDPPRGLVYLPVSTPSNDFLGGARPNLFAESIVCLDTNTGKLKWYQQLVHHGLWDYDLASPPNLVTIMVNGKKIDAVV